MTRKRKKLIFIAALVAASLFLLLEKNFLPGLSSPFSSDKHFKLLKIVTDLIRDDYVEKPDPQKTMEGAFKGLISSLDPLSSYLNQENLQKYRERKRTRFKETGAVFYKEPGTFSIVIGIKPGSPAEKSGLKIGDYVSELDGKSTMMLSMTETNLLQKEKEEKASVFKVLRMDKSEEIAVERAELFQEPFSYTQEEKTSGILRIHHFYAPCVRKAKEKILPKLKHQKMALIIDLRDCYEGDIAEARKFVNVFLKADSIGYLQKKNGAKKVISCAEQPTLETLPLVVWTNSATIGAAEAVAAILQNFDRAKVVGLQTPGLIAQQNLLALEDGSGLLLTHEIFFLPEGKELWQKGLKPDIQTEDDKQDDSHYLEKTFPLL